MKRIKWEERHKIKKGDVLLVKDIRRERDKYDGDKIFRVISKNGDWGLNIESIKHWLNEEVYPTSIPFYFNIWEWYKLNRDEAIMEIL